MAHDYFKIRALKEKQCDICFAWYNKKVLKGDICPNCLEELRTVPDIFTMEEKKSYLKNIRHSKRKNIFKNLSKNDMLQLKKCNHCVWLRNIDYFKLKIYCASPVCKKAV